MPVSDVTAAVTSSRFFQQDHGRRTPQRFLEHLQHSRVGEVAFTDLLCAADGPLERELVRRLLEAAGLEDASARSEEIDAETALPRYRLVGAHDLDPHLRRRGTRRSIVPDVFVGERDGRTAGSSLWRPFVAVEVKIGAMVNSRFDYCPVGRHVPGNGDEARSHYSSQVICYPRNCWLAEGVDPPVAYVWLGSRPRLVSPAFIERERVQAFARCQTEHLEMWRYVELDEVIGADGAMAAVGLECLAEVLRQRLRPRGR